MANFSISTVTKFLKDVRTELKKVVWPTRQQTVASTGVVIVMILIAGVLISVLDYFFAFIVKRLGF